MGRQILLELKLFVRRKEDLFWTLAFPLFFMLLYGFVYGDTQWSDYNIRAIDYMMPGLIVMALLVTGIMASATSFIAEREKGIYRRFSLTPLKKSTLLGAQIIQKYMVMVVQTLLLLAVGVLLFKVQIQGNFLWFWLVFTLGAFCFLCIGFLLTTFIKSSKAATPACMIVFFILMFLGGIFFPSSIMPGFLVAFSNFLPSTYLNNAFRIIMVEGQGLSQVVKEIGIVSAWLVVTLGLSIKFFKWE